MNSTGADLALISTPGTLVIGSVPVGRKNFGIKGVFPVKTDSSQAPLKEKDSGPWSSRGWFRWVVVDHFPVLSVPSPLSLFSISSDMALLCQTTSYPPGIANVGGAAALSTGVGGTKETGGFSAQNTDDSPSAGVLHFSSPSLLVSLRAISS